MTQLSAILAQSQGGGGIGGMLMIVAMIAIFYFMMIRPQNKKQKELKKQREAMQKGDRVVTAGGIHGKIVNIKDTTIIIQVAPDVDITVDKGSIYPVGSEEPAKK